MTRGSHHGRISEKSLWAEGTTSAKPHKRVTLIVFPEARQGSWEEKIGGEGRARPGPQWSHHRTLYRQEVQIRKEPGPCF
jgi:hypothetical protein